MIRRTAAFFLAVMMLSLAGASLADNPALSFYDSAAELLLETGNVTLTGEAVFSLDGERFKTANLRYIQDDGNSLYRLDLRTPRRNGSEGPDRESGYTIIANDGDVYVMEVFRPGIYKTGTMAPQYTILRRTVQMELMADLFRALADQAGALSGENAVTVQPDGLELRVALGEDVPRSVNTVLNLVYQFAAKRYFETDYDQISERDMVPMEYWPTVAEGILRSTVSLSLKKADVTATRDSSGNLERIGGDVSLWLHTALNGARQMDVAFSLNVSDRGESRVEKFDPAAYGVTRAGGPEETGEIGAGERIYFDEAETLARAEETRALLEKSGFTPDGAVVCAAYTEKERVCTEIQSMDGTEDWRCVTDLSGKVLDLHHVTNSFQQVDTSQYHFEEYPDAKLVAEAAEKALRYVEEVSPETRERVTALQQIWWYETDGELFMEFQEDPISQDTDGCLIAVRVQPEWRIEYFSCVSNG